MTPEIFHSIILIITTAFSFFLVKTPLFQYDLQITAFLFVLYFLSKRLLKSQLIAINSKFLSQKLIDSVVFTLVILNFINSTGGPSSHLFFLNYFLIFALSLLLEPIISITFSLNLVIFYLINLSSNQSLKEIITIFSLPFLTPFALLLGQEHLKIQKLKIKNQKLKEETFLFLTLIIKNHLKNIKEAVENFMGDHHLQIIKKSVRRLERLIDRFEKNS